jgi:hypothetical protein
MGLSLSPFAFAFGRVRNLWRSLGFMRAGELRMWNFRFFSATAAAVLAVAVAGTVSASAQSFVISQNGKSVGTASLSLKASGSGFDATSGAKIDMPGLNYKFSQNESLDAGYHLAKVQLSGSVNGTSATVNTVPQGQQYLMKINANGNVTNTPLAFHPQAVFLPDFDPGALQVLLNLGAAHNNRDLWALIPKQTGAVAALRVVTNADMQGTLSGSPVSVHHLTVTFDGGNIELFSGPANELLQAEWTDEAFAMVRNGFKLTPSAKPTMPPPARPADAPAQPQTPQQQ